LLQPGVTRSAGDLKLMFSRTEWAGKSILPAMRGFAKSTQRRRKGSPAPEAASAGAGGRQHPYDWISGYLETKGLRGFTRALIATLVVAIGSIPLALTFSRYRSTEAISHPTSIAITVCCAVTAGLWLADWPTRRQSALFVITATTCIATACLLDADPDSGLTGCAAFIAFAVYVALFHTFWLLSAYLAVAVGVLAYTTYHLAVVTEDPIVAGCKFLLMLTALLAASLCQYAFLRLLRADAGRGTSDSLTGLLTRSGFQRAALRLMASPPDKRARGPDVFAMFVIDLDQFKTVNDTKGHAEGDRALVEVADALGGAVRPSAAVGRVGGEEFAVADVAPRSEVEAIAERLRRAVAMTSFDITASVGASVTDPKSLANKDFQEVLSRLMDRADSAMYEAKRDGGDRFVIARPRRRPPGTDEDRQSPPTGPLPAVAPEGGSANGEVTDSGRWPSLPEVGRMPAPDPSWSTQWT
jgi:diguanylate cyclase (GGDEF)-like protein